MMPGGDGTGPSGTLINCTDPRTGLTRPLYRYRFGGFMSTPMPQRMTPPTHPYRAPIYQRYNNPSYSVPAYGGYGYGNYGYPAYRYRPYGYGMGMRRGRGWGGRGRGRW